MANSNGIITAPVRLTQDVQPILGIGGDPGYVITHGQIDPWAKYKPIRRNKVLSVTDSDRAAANYGLSVPRATANTIYNLIPYYDGELNGWSYNRPRGMSYEEWFRLLDFDNYTNSPQKPIRSYSALESVVYNDSQQQSPFQAAGFIGPTDASGLSIELKDIASILGTIPSNLYFGVALIKGTGLTPSTAANARKEITTSGGPLTKSGDGSQYTGTTVFFSKTNIRDNYDKGLWTLIPFLSLGEIPQCGDWNNTSIPTNVVFPLPLVSISQIDLQSRTDTYTITFEGYNTGIAIRATVKIANTGTSSFSKRLTLFIWDAGVSGKPGERDPLSYEQSYELSRTIASGETYTWTPLIRSADQLLLQRGVAYIQVESEATVRGPYSFYRESPTL